MWIYVYVNGRIRGLRWCSGQKFIDSVEAWAKKRNLDVIIVKA